MWTRGTFAEMSEAADVSDAVLPVGQRADAVAVDQRPALGEDEYAQIVRASGFCSVHVRAVCHSFHRLWSEPATWAGIRLSWPAAVDSLAFLFRHALPALVQASALDTHAVGRNVFEQAPAEFQRLHDELSLRRFNAMPAVNSGLPPAKGWYRPASGFAGVSENVQTDGLVARRKIAFVPGMAAVCGDGPISRDAHGRRAFGLRIEQTDSTLHGGIYVGFVATPPHEINFDNAMDLWATAAMWRWVQSAISCSGTASGLDSMPVNTHQSAMGACRASRGSSSVVYADARRPRSSMVKW